MNGVGPTTSRIGKRPFLDGTALRFSKNTLINGRPGNTVDFPFAVAVLKLEIVFGWSMGWWERDVSESLREAIRKIVRSVRDRVAYYKAFKMLAVFFVRHENFKGAAYA